MKVNVGTLGGTGTVNSALTIGKGSGSDALLARGAVGLGTLTYKKTRDASAGYDFTAINDTATPPSTAVSVTSDGSTFTASSNAYMASYEGGTANDLILTVQ